MYPHFKTPSFLRPDFLRFLKVYKGGLHCICFCDILLAQQRPGIGLKQDRATSLCGESQVAKFLLRQYWIVLKLLFMIDLILTSGQNEFGSFSITGDSRGAVMVRMDWPLIATPVAEFPTPSLFSLSLARLYKMFSCLVPRWLLPITM